MKLSSEITKTNLITLETYLATLNLGSANVKVREVEVFVSTFVKVSASKKDYI